MSRSPRRSGRFTASAFLAAVLTSGCATAPARPGFVAIYRWQVKAGCEAEVRAAWRAEAERYRDRYGSLGSRLHRGDDGSFVATAFWSSPAAWAAAPRPIDLPGPEQVLDRCIESKVQELHLTTLEDVPPGG